MSGLFKGFSYLESVSPQQFFSISQHGIFYFPWHRHQVEWYHCLHQRAGALTSRPQLPNYTIGILAYLVVVNVFLITSSVIQSKHPVIRTFGVRHLFNIKAEKIKPVELVSSHIHSHPNIAMTMLCYPYIYYIGIFFNCNH